MEAKTTATEERMCLSIARAERKRCQAKKALADAVLNLTLLREWLHRFQVMKAAKELHLADLNVGRAQYFVKGGEARKLKKNVHVRKDRGQSYIYSTFHH
jgi:hypothetical protein